MSGPFVTLTPMPDRMHGRAARACTQSEAASLQFPGALGHVHVIIFDICHNTGRRSPQLTGAGWWQGSCQGLCSVHSRAHHAAASW